MTVRRIYPADVLILGPFLSGGGVGLIGGPGADGSSGSSGSGATDVSSGSSGSGGAVGGAEYSDAGQGFIIPAERQFDHDDDDLAQWDLAIDDKAMEDELIDFVIKNGKKIRTSQVSLLVLLIPFKFKHKIRMEMNTGIRLSIYGDRLKRYK